MERRSSLRTLEGGRSKESTEEDDLTLPNIVSIRKQLTAERRTPQWLPLEEKKQHGFQTSLAR